MLWNDFIWDYFIKCGYYASVMCGEKPWDVEFVEAFVCAGQAVSAVSAAWALFCLF